MKIAIWGLGVSGISTLKFYQNKDCKIYLINKNHIDVNSYRYEKFILESELESLDIEFDLIVISPGVDKRTNAVQKFVQKGIDIVSDIEILCRHTQKDIIAITGTNGKTTTTTMIAQGLENANIKPFVGGNIGTAALDYFADESRFDCIVLELSSFQLESSPSLHPKIGFILNITPSHMERYDHFDDYADAKKNIALNMNSEDLLYLGDGVKIENNELHCKQIEEITGYDLSQIRVRGNHNLKNLFCAHSVVEYMAPDKCKEAIQKLINEFRGVEFRLENLGTKRGKTFYNDAKSTNITSTITALNAFQDDESICLFLGGKLRENKVEILQDLKSYAINEIIVYGEASELLFEDLSHDFKVYRFKNLNEAFENIDKFESKNLIFSPAFPSFDQYKNYIERGRHFNNLYDKLI